MQPFIAIEFSQYSQFSNTMFQKSYFPKTNELVNQLEWIPFTVIVWHEIVFDLMYVFNRMLPNMFSIQFFLKSNKLHKIRECFELKLNERWKFDRRFNSELLS